jgi:hypothetical protein
LARTTRQRPLQLEKRSADLIADGGVAVLVVDYRRLGYRGVMSTTATPTEEAAPSSRSGGRGGTWACGDGDGADVMRFASAEETASATGCGGGCRCHVCVVSHFGLFCFVCVVVCVLWFVCCWCSMSVFVFVV